MGVTIHFEGNLRSEEAFVSACAVIRTYAAQRAWHAESFSLERTRLARVSDEREWDYVGPTRGVIAYPHAESEPFRFEVDSNLYLQEFTKTQFAGVNTHIAVVELLRELQPFFVGLVVEDEGEFWSTSDPAVLQGHLEACEAALKAELKKHPAAQARVHLPSGRIADLIT